MKPIRRLSVVHFAAAALSLALALPAGAAIFVKDVMLIGGNQSEVNTLKTNLLGQGWTFIAKDLNDGAGGDFVHLLYKKVDTPGGNSCYGFVTGFYIKSGSGAPDSLTYDGRTYYLTPYAGGSHFVGQNGDLNSHTGDDSDSIHLYYTKDAVSPERSVNSIWFDDSSSGAVGKNGSSDGYDLNKNAGGAFIYMHYSTDAASTTVNLSALAMDYTAANGITLTGTLTANVGVSIASNATVTLSNATIDARSGFTGSGITCEGDATIILNGVNKTSGSNPGDVWNGGAGIRVLANTTLTIRGTGSLEAIGKGVAAAIGGGERIISSFGNIVIEGGTITARGGIQSAAIGGSSQDIGMPGNITITGGTVDARDDPPAEYQKSVGIGTGQYGTCGNITISGGIVNAVNIGSCVTESVCGNITISGGTVNGGHIGPRFSSCGNITISGGTVTATKNGGIHSIGKYSDSDTCGTVKIGGVTTGFIVQDPITYSSTDTTTYTAAFDANGGMGATAAITSRPDTPHQIPTNGFTRAGYTFAEWNDAANGSGTSYDVDQWVILRNTTIYAQWSRLTYSIGYTLNSGSLPSGKTNPTSYNVDTATFTLNNPTRNYYNFAGWTWTGQTTPQISVTIPTGSTGDKSYIANWTPIDYPISYDLAGGALPSGTSNPVSYNVTSSAIELVNPARIGYTFAGWTWTGQTTPQASVTIPTGSYGDKSYTANWTPVNYVVRFDANGAGGSMSDQTFTYDEAQNLRANAFYLTGYSHAGWSDSADGAVLYADGANVSNLTATAGTVVTLYAVWSQTPWMTLQKRLDQGGTVVLSGDVAKTDVDECLMVTNAVTLDLNGHMLTGFGDDAVLYVVNDGDLTLTNSVEGAGAITGGTGGVVVYDEGVFTMNGGAISGNRNNFGRGGGVYVDDEGVFTMNGGAISGNSAFEGGGVYVTDDGAFTMTGGVIANNSCMRGGGVCVSGGTFTMNGGAISGNAASEYGGGVECESSFTMTGGTITGNSSVYGGGVDLFEGVMTVSANPVVSGNTNFVGEASNVSLPDGVVIVVDGLSAGASIGVSTENAPTALHPVVLTSGAAAGDDRYFTGDNPGCFVAMANGEVCLAAPMTWEDLQDALDAGGAVTLLNDVAAGKGDTSLVVSGAVRLDLAGHTITGNDEAGVIVIDGGGDLTLTNSVPASGAITGGRAEQGGGVRVDGNAAFTMDGGVISGNAADPGGGVFVDSHGTFTMNGGAITNNFSAGRRGGGGGVCVYSSATVTLNGGKISGNVANAMGGGVCLFSCTFTVSGNPVVSGNTDAEGATSNIDLPYSQKIGVGTLSAGASIGVTTGWPDAMHHVVITSGASAGNSRYFFCDVSYFHVEDNGGEVCIVTSVTPWTTLQKQLLEGGTVTLTNDCAASAYDYPLYVTNAVTLDLAGHTIAGNGDSEVISIEGGDLTLTNSVEGAGAVTGGSMGVYVNKDGVFTMNGGTISGNSSPYSNNGGGVFVAGGAFTMNDGLISGNGADDGGGVRVGTGYSYDTWEKIPGTFTMNGGVISGNSADDDGGGVYVYEDAAFALNGGMISGNRADLGGGVYVDSNAIFSMTGGTISNNIVKSESSSWYEARGGGVYDYGAFTMTGGEISGNDADFGGGVYVYDGGAFTMTGGTVSGNNADEDGGGVYVEDDAIFMMNGGAISGNTAHFGGGVYVSYDSLFTMTGGAISGNSADYGGGVLVYYDSLFTMTGGEISGNAAEYGGGVCFSEGEMLVSGSPVISGNTGSAMSSHNVYLEGTLTVSNLTVGASIGVKTSSRPDWDSPVTFTEGAEAGDKDCFFSDDPACSVDVGAGGELCLKRVREDAWTLLQARLDAGGAVTLADSVSAPSLDTPSLVVTNAVTLDLAGHTISGSFHDSIFRIGAGGVLTITNSVEGVGAVTGGYNWYGGGVYVGSNGVFRLQGGAISGNRAYSGGGVSVDEFGVFTMTGGAISGNQAEGGGGVSVYGDSDDCLCPGVFTMSGGTISGNVAYDGFGGGMYMEGDAVVTLTGGEISGNAAVSWGEYGGVAVFSSAFTVAGNPVVFGNTNDVGEASNVYLPDGMTIFVDGLSAGASIGVTSEIKPEDGNPVVLTDGAAAGDIAYFFSDDPGYHVGFANGEVCLVAPMTWERLQTALDAGGAVTLPNDIAAGEGDTSLVVSGAVLLDLNGCTITGNGENEVIFIDGGGDLTLTNSVPSSGAITGGNKGVYVYYGGAFTMNGGVISGNNSDEYGGGVYMYDHGTFTMNGGAVSGNNSYTCGGGVHVGSGCTFTMNGGSISGNTSYEGGGVYVEGDGVFTMTGGAISGNAASWIGGGVSMWGTSFTMAGGTIAGNCSVTGGGVSFEGDMMEVSASPVVSGNTNFFGEANNVYLEWGSVITVDGLSAGASIGVVIIENPDVFDTLAVTEGAAAGDSRYFSSDSPGIVVDERNGEVCFTAPHTPWRALQAQLDQGGIITLTNDFAAQVYDNSLFVTNTVLLDLAGHTLAGNRYLSVICIGEGGALTLTNSVEGLGAITGGGYSGVSVEYGAFTMNGGAISGNYSPDIGGGVYVGWDGAFTMNGGEITGNVANDYGGGVFVDGAFTMSGGTISGNSAESGGGVVVYEDGAFTMNGGAISGNSASNGGGVYADKDGTFTVSGNPVISGNTNFVGEAGNVFLPDGAAIVVDGLSAGASIGVTAEIVPEDGHPVAIAVGATSGDAARFFSDDPGRHVELDEGELYLVVGVALPTYLEGASEQVIANYAAWAARYGPDVNSAHEAAFLLDIDPATPIPVGAALLKIVAFRITATSLHFEVASDVTTFVEKENGMLGNGFLALSLAPSLSSNSNWSPPVTVPFEIRNGRAVIDMEGESENGEQGEPGSQMPPAAFFKAVITPFADAVIGIEE